jgi:signal transduction histidine kinase
MPSVTLAARLLLAFGLLAVASTATIGILVRDAWREAENQRFRARVEGAREGVRLELAYEQASVRDLLRPLCEHDAFVDRTLVDLQAGRLDSGRRLALAQLVPDEMKALRLDELVLVTGSGEVLGAGHAPALAGVTDPLLAAQLAASDATFPSVRAPARASDGKHRPAALMARCTRKAGPIQIGLIGARYLAGVRERVGKAYGVRLAIADEPDAAPAPGETTTEVALDERSKLRMVVATSRRGLDEALTRLDEVVFVTGGVTLLAAMLFAIVLARSLGSPIAQLAREVREVVAGEPREVAVHGTTEMRELARAFNRTLHDLAMLRRRHAAVERIAAWREVARRVAHEIKNPLTPIRSSMETLRRLKDRSDPAFDEYFEQATKGVLDDVHRIATIASDFARFARLPSPRPAPLDLAEVARGVVAMHQTPGVRLEVLASPCPEVNADRDQIVQMLTNLVQNAMDAVRGGAGEPRVDVLLEPAVPDAVRLAVRDNGTGVAADLVPKLFEPYVTTKAHGTGLGLPIVQRIVLEHGGEISYAPAPGGGACFTVVLPCTGPVPVSSPTPEVQG